MLVRSSGTTISRQVMTSDNQYIDAKILAQTFAKYCPILTSIIVLAHQFHASDIFTNNSAQIRMDVSFEPLHLHLVL